MPWLWCPQRPQRLPEIQLVCKSVYSSSSSDFSNLNNSVNECGIPWAGEALPIYHSFNLTVTWLDNIGKLKLGEFLLVSNEFSLLWAVMVTWVICFKTSGTVSTFLFGTDWLLPRMEWLLLEVSWFLEQVVVFPVTKFKLRTSLT